ncbi:hypothetical protein GJAV_G00126610 [Gymnothorax javanicus]|nr:hypothetical protein GJAV_G00126610 [Gymnothorax javanicus]
MPFKLRVNIGQTDDNHIGTSNENRRMELNRKRAQKFRRKQQADSSLRSAYLERNRQNVARYRQKQKETLKRSLEAQSLQREYERVRKQAYRIKQKLKKEVSIVQGEEDQTDSWQEKESLSVWTSMNPDQNSQDTLSQAREMQLTAPPLWLNIGSPPVDPASALPVLPRPEKVDISASELPVQPNSAFPLPGPAPSFQTTAPPTLQSQWQAAVLSAEETVLQKMRWASQELPCANSVEASIQLCSLIRSCADSLCSLGDLKLSPHF